MRRNTVPAFADMHLLLQTAEPRPTKVKVLVSFALPQVVSSVEALLADKWTICDDGSCHVALSAFVPGAGKRLRALCYPSERLFPC